MNKVKNIGFFMLCLMMFFHSNYTAASNRARTLSFSLGSGYQYFSTKRHIDNTDFPFVALGYNMTDHLGIESVLSIFTTPSRRVEDNNRQVRGTSLALDGVYHFTSFYMIDPFILAGIGIVSMNPNGTDANNQGNINGGAGIGIFIDPSIAFRMEARSFYTTVGGKNDVVLDGGLTFLLDMC